MPCINHNEIPANYQCLKCKKYFCKDCIKKKEFTGSHTFLICPECGQECQDLRELVRQYREDLPLSFWDEFPKIFAYPICGDGLYILIGGAFVFGPILPLANMVLFGQLGTILWSMLITIWLYIAAYLLKVIRLVAFGHDTPPGWWPSMPDFHEHFFGDALFAIVAALICLGSSYFYLKGSNMMAEILFSRLAPYLGPQFKPVIHLEFKELLIFSILLVTGYFIFPMCLILISITESIVAFNPWLIIRAIGKVFREYFIVVILFFLFAFLGIIIAALGSALPLIGTTARGFLLLYAAIMDACLLGIFYRVHAKKFDTMLP